MKKHQTPKTLFLAFTLLTIFLSACGQISSDTSPAETTPSLASAASNPFTVDTQVNLPPQATPTPNSPNLPNNPNPSPSPTPTPTPAATATPLATATPTATPTPSSTPQVLPQLNGWTTFTPEPGARMVYVSAAGNDANPGTEISPKRTLAAGYDLLRDGQGDWLLLRRGDTFSLSSTFFWTKSGPGTGAGWMRLTAYGDQNLPRPRIDSPVRSDALHITPGYQSARRMTNLAFTDVHILNSARLANPAAAENSIAISTVAVQWQGSGLPFSNILFENVYFHGFSFALNISNDLENLTVRRSIFHYIFSVTGHASAVLAAPSGFLLEDNLFYLVQNADIPGLGSNADSQFTHAAYIGAAATNVVNRGNIVIKAPDGMMQRSGGIYSRNVTAHCNVGGLMGQAWGVTPTPGGVQSNMTDNVILNARSMSFILGNTASGQITNNLFVRDQNGTNPFGLWFVPRNDTGSGTNIGVHNTNFSGNILSHQFDWNSGDTLSFSGLSFSNNQQNIGPVNSNVGAFLAQSGISGSTIDDWANFLLMRDRGNYSALHTSTPVINFYRAQVGMSPVP